MVVARYHADGRLDGSFGGDGLVAIDLGDTRDLVYAMAIQADGRILLAGERVAVNSIEDLGFLARLTTSGALDPGFGGGDGVVDVPGTRDDRVRAVAVQTDGRIVVAGCTSVGGSYVGHAMLVRYDSAGRLDTGFGTNGVSTTVHASGERSEVYGFAIAADGAIYAAADLQQADFAPDLPVVQRYLPDGRLDSQFGTDGWLGLEALESALSVATLSDGRVVVGGQSRATYWDVGAVRLLADGRFDTSFGAGNGIAYADVDGDFTGFAGMALAPDGGVVFAAQVYEDFANDVGPALGLLRLTADGQRDLAFGRAGSLGGAAEWEVGAPAAVLDADACVTDVELAAAGGYAGATLTLQRRGGPDAADAFSAHWRGTLGALDAGGPLVVDGTSVGTVEANSSGTLRLRFGEAATQERVDAVMRQIAYSNAVLGPGASVALEWTFDDGNAGAQGSGGAGRAAATTVVAVVADATPPPAPVVASATDDQPEGIGALASGAITNDATPTLAGTAEPGSTVEVLAGASTIGSTTADAAGRWQLPATALPDGETRFTAVASDSGGRASGASAPFTLTIDSRAPDAPTIAGASDDEGAQQGPLSPGSLTDDRTPALAGTAEPGSTVRVYAGASAVGTTTADASGAWAVTTAALSPGEVSLTAKASDAAGNTGGASAAFAFTLVDVVVGTDAQDTLAGTEGIDSMLGLAGDDSIDGADGVDVAVFAAPRAQVTLSLNAGASGSGAAAGTGASAALGTDAFDGIERLKFADAVLALDTRGPDENAYDVVALLHCALGALPPQSELARFLPLADAGADAAAVGDAIIAHYAPGVPTEALVAFLWFQLTGTPVPAGVPESFAALVGPGLPFPTQGALYAAASMLELNTVRFAGLIADGLALPADWYA